MAAVAMAVSAAAAPARACGPDFPPEILSRRDQCLATLPDGSFSGEVAKLVPRPAGTFHNVDAEEPAGLRAGGGERERELYARGARAFHKGDWNAAMKAFAALLALPPQERRHFSTMAAFMLGRIGPDWERRFGEVRELANAGFEDPLGLAAASYGEEARRHLYPALYHPAGSSRPVPDRDDPGAIRLYAMQAAVGSQDGALSLLFVARALAADPARLERALPDPLVQRLLTTYAWTRGGGGDWPSADASLTPTSPLLVRLASVPHLAGADRLAAAAWRAGGFDLAERFAGAEDTPLALWVQAKLAFRRGNRAAAERLLAQASARTPPDEIWTGPGWTWKLRVRSRLEGERAVLALARGDRAAAFEHVLAAGYWPDVAYVAERVLDLDELRAAVDRGVRPGPPPAFSWADGDPRWSPPDPGRRLRELLARRMVREGHAREALPYFGDPAVAALARRYAEALESARRGSKTDRAEALWHAALLARASGMEIMGTEVAPDWSWLEGEYPSTTAVDGELATPPASPALVTEAERRRAADHAPPHDLRFHYRAVAGDHAEAAAALVPPRSQAFAALLCVAARSVRRVDPVRTLRFWSTYVQKGAIVPFAGTFGQECPAPDFDRVRHPPPRRLSFHLPRKRTLAAWAAIALALGVAGIAGWRMRRIPPDRS
jgi:hypothetical protein